MSEPAARDEYRPLDAARLRAWLAGLPAREALGGDPGDWRVREIGDGNLNLVFIVEGPAGALCVKQALPYVRVAGPSWPMTPSRAAFEWAYFETVAPYVGAAIPRMHHFDPQSYCIVMECLAEHVILRRGLMQARRFERAAGDVGTYVARACFHTSDLALPVERKMQSVARFAGNHDLVRITVDLVFTDPYREAARNRHTSPQLDDAVQALRADDAVKIAAARLGAKFLTEAQALIHGDLHSGSVMVSVDETRIIDPEFAFYGPIGFDLGAFLANLLLNWYALDGLVPDLEARAAQRLWLTEQMRSFWNSFSDCFLGLWRGTVAVGDAFPASTFADPGAAAALDAQRRAYVEALFADMLGFAACKMIRRIVGFAHVADLESIADPQRRAACERAALALARRLLACPREFRRIDDLIDAVAQARA